MKGLLRKTFLLAISVGWLLPTGFGFAFIDEWVRLDVFPIIHGTTQKSLNSFPSYQAGKELLIFGFTWLCISIIGWGAYFAYRKTFSQSALNVRQHL